MSLEKPQDGPITEKDTSKRSAPERGCHSEPRDIFVNNIPFNVTEAGLITALKRMFGKLDGFKGVKKVNTQRGFAILEFSSGESAEDAVTKNQNAKLGPRTLNVKLSDPMGAKVRRIERENESNQQRSDVLGHETDPNPDCWFCLANPSVDKDLIYTLDPSAEIYMSLSKGPISDLHSFVCPVTHFGCFAQASETVKNLCLEYSESFTSKMDAEGMDTIIFERWIPLNSTAANHMQVHLVPVLKEKNREIDWTALLKEKGISAGIDFVQVRDHSEVAQKLAGVLNRVSYLFLSVSDGAERKCWLGIGKMSFTFPREIVCSALGCPERIDWRSCEASVAETEKNVGKLRSLFHPS
jgi:RNA recognition motif-containing protein